MDVGAWIAASRAHCANIRRTRGSFGPMPLAASWSADVLCDSRQLKSAAGRLCHSWRAWFAKAELRMMPRMPPMFGTFWPAIAGHAVKPRTIATAIELHGPRTLNLGIARPLRMQELVKQHRQKLDDPPICIVFAYLTRPARRRRLQLGAPKPNHEPPDSDRARKWRRNPWNR